MEILSTSAALTPELMADRPPASGYYSSRLADGEMNDIGLCSPNVLLKSGPEKGRGKNTAAEGNREKTIADSRIGELRRRT